MRKQALTITLCVLLAGALVAVALLAPGALSAWRRMEKELAATPTPTADISSVLLVTADPNNTPTPTVLLLKIGVTGDEVTRLQQRLLCKRGITAA